MGVIHPRVGIVVQLLKELQERRTQRKEFNSLAQASGGAGSNSRIVVQAYVISAIYINKRNKRCLHCIASALREHTVNDILHKNVMQIFYLNSYPLQNALINNMTLNKERSVAAYNLSHRLHTNIVRILQGIYPSWY